jgi:hypothetical protein
VQVDLHSLCKLSFTHNEGAATSVGFVGENDDIPARSATRKRRGNRQIGVVQRLRMGAPSTNRCAATHASGIWHRAAKEVLELTKGVGKKMIEKSWSAVLMGIGILGLASACSVEATSAEQEAVGSTDQALVCANQDGTNAYMAALGAAAGREIGRWLPTRDFQWNSTTWKLELSSYGKRRCADRFCFNVQELLNMQNPAANNLVVFPGGDRLNTQIVNQRLKATWDRQVTCNNRPDNHTGDDCPTEYHELTLTKIASGACDKIQEAVGSTDQALWCANQDGTNAYMAALAAATGA